LYTGKTGGALDVKIKVSGRGQVCLPVALRRRLNIEAGDLLEVQESGETLVLRPVRPKRDEKVIAALLERTAGIWRHLSQDGAIIVRELRRESTRDVWAD
jgi:AbrB family looped-hinge helix DNA binding protein